MAPPIVEFGAPVQRARASNESYWHVPVKIRPRLGRIGPATVSGCQVYLDFYDGDQIRKSHLLCWGDQLQQSPREYETIRFGHTSLVPVAWRLEGSTAAFLADARFVLQKAQIHELSDKSRFKLRIVSGSFKRESPHYYLVRCPPLGVASNGLFITEIEYEGDGTKSSIGGAYPRAPVQTSNHAGTNAKPKREPTPYEIEQKLKKCDELLELLRSYAGKRIVPDGNQIRSNPWHSTKAGAAAFLERCIDYRNDVTSFTSSLEAFRLANAHHEEIALLVPSLNDMGEFANAVTVFSMTIERLAKIPELSEADFLFLLEPREQELTRCIRRYAKQETDGIDKLIQMRKSISL